MKVLRKFPATRSSQPITDDLRNRKGSYPDRYFTLRSTYLQGRPPQSVNMYWRRFSISEIPLNNQEEFNAWLLARWVEKDQLLEEFFATGRFPSNLQASISSNGAPPDQKREAPIPYLETSIRLAHWIEIGKIFIVFTGVILLFKLTKLWGEQLLVHYSDMRVMSLGILNGHVN
jgi:Acyltransferase C-terminus